MSEQIEVKAAGIDKYKKLEELVKNTHKEKPKQENLAELRRLFDEDPELWRTTATHGQAHFRPPPTHLLFTICLCARMR